MGGFTAAAVQLTTGRNIAKNIERSTELIRAAAAEGATFISTPETTHLMELDRDRVVAISHMESDDPGVHAYGALAKELGVWLHIGSLIIKRPDGRMANRSFLFAPTGEIAARYDKLHMFDVTVRSGERYEESALYEAGDRAVLVTGGVPMPLGISICYDLRFAGLYRQLAEAGAEMLLIPAAFTRPTGEAHWHTLLKARAIETGSYVIAAAQSGMHETGRETYGHSLIIDPWGEVLGDAPSGEGYVLTDIEPAKVEKVRQRIPVLSSANPAPLSEVAVPTISRP